MDFIFMLTREDRTVADCLDIVDAVGDLGLMHMGFKDVGVGPDLLAALNKRIRESGATSYMEVVATTPEEAAEAARLAVDLDVECLLGGCAPRACLSALGESEIAYYPFPGRPRGLPTVLHGTIDEIVADCRQFAEAGCAGVDLLAYRAVEADPIELIHAVRSAIEGDVIVAGDVNTPQRVRDIAAAGADAFTVGTAALSGAFAPGRPGLCAQLEAIMEACARAR